MADVEKFLRAVILDEHQTTRDRLHAATLLANLYPETFKPEPPIPTPVEDLRLFDLLVEAYLEGWKVNSPPRKDKGPFWDAGATRAVKRLLERYNNA